MEASGHKREIRREQQEDDGETRPRYDQDHHQNVKEKEKKHSSPNKEGFAQWPP